MWRVQRSPHKHKSPDPLLSPLPPPPTYLHGTLMHVKGEFSEHVSLQVGYSVQGLGLVLDADAEPCSQPCTCPHTLTHTH